MGLAKWSYYARSIPLMLRGIANWTSIPLALASGQGKVLRLAGLTFLYRDAMDIWTIKETCLDDHYRVRQQQLRPNGTIIDVGAGLGDFAIMMAHRYPQAQVLAFEPFPESAILCRRNMALNQVPNMILLEQALGETGGTVSLDISSRESVQHSTVREAGGNGTITVAKQTLADIFAEYHIERCDMLKLDCEGAEFEILLGLDKEILQKIDRISLEYHNSATAHSHRELISLFEAAGFSVEHVPNVVHSDIGYLYAQR
jgi:FkbM family methyltransferase